MPQSLKISTPVILASASPRRRELIGMAFSDVHFFPSSASEDVPSDLPPERAAPFLAERKALDVARFHPECPVIGCDTVVINNDRILTKPKDENEAYQMLSELSGREHRVCTGCCIVFRNKIHTFEEFTIVKFWPLSDDRIRSYILTGEPMDKAGAYGIQALGGLFVREIKGDYFNVVGLPISRLHREFSFFLSTGDEP